MKNEELDKLLFSQNENKNDFKTESLYNSLEIEPINKYIIPDNKEINDYSLKNKIQNVNSSLKLSQINFKSLQINSISYDNYKHNSDNFVNLLLEIIIELMWKVKEKSNSCENIVEQYNLDKLKYEEYEKKNKRLNNEINDLQKELKFNMNKTYYDKEKSDINKKTSNTEINDLRLSNKKLNNMVINYKNEMKKKEIDYEKLKEKIRRFLNDKAKIPEFICDKMITNKKTELLENYVNSNNNKKYNLVISQNEILMNILHKINQIVKRFLENLSQKFKEFNIVEFVNISQSLFSIHLLEDNLNYYKQIYIENLVMFEKVLSDLIDYKKKNIPNNENDGADIIKNFKRWSIDKTYSDNNFKNSKWYDRIDNNSTKNIYFNN